jgi:glycosyltransferase involved in cell wall biosynthesis
MKQKVLVFHPALATYRVDFFNTLDENFEVKFYFERKKQTDHVFSENYLQSKCTFQSNYLLNGFEFFGRSIRFGIIAIIKKEKPDIILCNEFDPSTMRAFYYYILNRKRFKLYTICDDSIDNSIKRRWLRYMARNIVSKNIDGVIFPSEEVCKWYKKNISIKPKTLVLPIIHSDEIFRHELAKSLKKANDTIESYDLIGKKVLLFVGRLVKVKNIPFLIEAFAKLKSSDCVLVIVGGGELMNDLKSQTIDLKISERVYFTDRKEGIELLSWFAIAQLFILPSTYERYGAVVNEALLAGCKVLCSELAGASALISKENGYKFSPYREQELAHLLSEAISEIDPISKKISVIRENRMPFSFNEKIKVLFQDL